MKSSGEFLQAIRNSHPEGTIASLDVESLFTNVPVRETIDMIIDRVYHNDSTPDLDIPELALRTLLEICTMEAPFTDHKGQLYVQVDGVAMGSPLGVLFANFYMGTIEERVFSIIPRPRLYYRYIDDTFVSVSSEEELNRLKRTFEENSVLKFTFENDNDGSLPFLDVLVKQEEDRYVTSVYKKPTNEGLCLNGKSECPKRYLDSVIDSYARRALSHCTTWQDTHKELDRVSQILVNNGFSNATIDSRFKRAIDKWYAGNDHQPNQEITNERIKLFYNAIMHQNYKQEEQAIRKIIDKNVKPADENAKIDLIIYYKNSKTRNLIMKNNPRPHQDDLKAHHVVYHFKCPVGGMCPHNYVGKTTTTLSKRLSCHAQEGAIFLHFSQCHGRRPTREELTNNTEILHRASDDRRLSFMEALLIREHKPSLNTTNEILLSPSHMNRVVIGNRTIQNPPDQGNLDQTMEEGNDDTNQEINNTPENRDDNPYNLRPRRQVDYQE